MIVWPACSGRPAGCSRAQWVLEDQPCALWLWAYGWDQASGEILWNLRRTPAPEETARWRQILADGRRMRGDEARLWARSTVAHPDAPLPARQVACNGAGLGCTDAARP